MPLSIAIDIGNSRVKLGYFDQERLLHVDAFLHAEFPAACEASAAWQRYSGDSKYIGLASVGNEAMLAATHKLVASKANLEILTISKDTPMAIGNQYKSIETLGIDRLIVASAAYRRAGKGPVLVINAGTAVTFDFVDENGDYLGGSIAPGLRTRFKALNTFTAALPLVKKDGPTPLIGYDTETSIRSGVVNGMVAELEGLIGQYKSLSSERLIVYLTGGDADFLGNHLKSVTFVDANLLLHGINTIVLHHA